MCECAPATCPSPGDPATGESVCCVTGQLLRAFSHVLGPCQGTPAFFAVGSMEHLGKGLGGSAELWKMDPLGGSQTEQSAGSQSLCRSMSSQGSRHTHRAPLPHTVAGATVPGTHDCSINGGHWYFHHT